MQALIALAVKRPVSTLMCFCALLIFGFIAAGDLSVEFLPALQVPKLIVSAASPGLPPAQVKDLLAVPLEDALSSVKGIRSVLSISRAGQCTVELEFHWGTDMMLAAVETREAIDLAYPSLPSGLKKPVVLPINPGEEPLIWVGVFARSGDLTLARRLADREIKTRLQQEDGVGSITLLGGLTEEIKVEVDLSRSVSLGVSLDAVAQALAQNNYDFPAGSFTEGGTEFLVKTEGRFLTEADIGALVIGQTERGNRIRLADIATVARGAHEQTSFFQLNGREGVALLVRRKGGENPLKVSRNVRLAVDRLALSHGRDVELSIAKDASLVIASSIRELASSGLIGALIAFLVLLLFTRRLSTALILTSTIPVATVVTLLLLKISGSSLNTMSLGGLAMGIGMIVDNSVVVLENLERRLPDPAARTPERIIASTAEMAGSTLGSTLTSLVVFMPILFLPGIVGALFKDLALSIGFAQILSFIVSITLVPVLFRLSTRARRPKRAKSKSAGRMDAFGLVERLYRRGLRLSLRKPFIFALGVGLVFGAGVLALSLLRFEFMPPVDSGEINVTASFPPGTSLEYISRSGRALADQAAQSGLIGTTLLRAGGESDDPHYLSDPGESAEQLRLSLALKEGQASSLRALADLRPLFQLHDAAVSLSLPDDIIAPVLGIRGAAAVYLVKGRDQEEAARQAAGFEARLAATGFFSSLVLIPRRDQPGVRLSPKREQLSRFKLSLLEAANALQGYLDGLYPAQFNEAGRTIDIRIRLREEDRSNLEGLGRIELLSPSGGRVKLSDCLTLTEEKEYSCLIRREKKDVAWLEAVPREETVARAERILEETLVKPGRAESLARSAFEANLPRILLTFALAVLLLYLVLGAQFESFTLPLFLMLSLPLSFSGIVLALVLFGKSVNLSSSLGILVLLGVAVSNSIILYENYRGKIDAGAPMLFAVYRGSAERLKAILISVVTTVTALLPVAIDPLQKSAQSPMAVAILGGLTVSTLLTLFVTPLLFRAFFRRKAR